MSKRILLFGANSQIGAALRRQALPADWQTALLTRADCDFMQPSSISRAIQSFAPSLVINAAAMTDIDACEQAPDRALTVNFEAVANIAAQCVALDAPLIQISTDYVFDGADGDRPYRPDDLMNPLNVYGQSKMMGEEAVRQNLHWHVILRTSLVFGAHGDNVLTKTLRQIDSLDDITAATDQKANPTGAATVARALIAMAEAILAGKAGGFGTFHLCDEPAITRFEFLHAIMAAYALYTKRRPRLNGVAAADMPHRVPRPRCSTLSNEKIQAIYGIAPRDWHAELADGVKNYMEKSK